MIVDDEIKGLCETADSVEVVDEPPSRNPWVLAQWEFSTVEEAMSMQCRLLCSRNKYTPHVIITTAFDLGDTGPGDLYRVRLAWFPGECGLVRGVVSRDTAEGEVAHQA